MCRRSEKRRPGFPLAAAGHLGFLRTKIRHLFLTRTWEFPCLSSRFVHLAFSGPDGGRSGLRSERINPFLEALVNAIRFMRALYFHELVEVVDMIDYPIAP